MAAGPKPRRGWRPARRCGCRRCPTRRRRGARRALQPDDRAFVRGLVLYEDDEVLALNKPAGLAVQGGTKTTATSTGCSRAWGEGEKRPRLVHRLDRDTSGVLVLGKSPGRRRQLAGAFARRRTQKTYWAIVAGTPKPAEGVIELPLAKGGIGDREMVAPADPKDPQAEAAETEFVTDLPRRATRGLAGAASPHRPHPPAARPHAGGRPSDPRRSEIPHRGLGDAVRRPEAAAARAAHRDAASRRRRAGRWKRR